MMACLRLPEPALRSSPRVVAERTMVRLAVVVAATLALPPRLAVAAPPPAASAATAAAAGGAPGGSGDPKHSFEDAVNSFKYQDFDNAVPQLRALLYPAVRVEHRREWQAREYLGASLWWVGSKNEANDEFTALLVRDAAHKLDPAVYPPKMVADFETLRSTLIRLGVIKADAQPTEPVDVVQQPPPFGLMFVPFGVGQFANGSNLKGGLLLASEVVLASVSVAFYYVNARDALHGADRMTPVNKAVQQYSGGAFFAVAIAGIVEAALSWNGTPR